MYVVDDFENSLGEITEELSLSDTDEYVDDEDDLCDLSNSSDDMSVYLETTATAPSPISVDDDFSSCRESDSCIILANGTKPTTTRRLPRAIVQRVRFATDPKTGQVQCRYYANFLPIRPEDYPTVWYQRSDFSRYRRTATKLVMAARTSQLGLDVAAIYESCASSKKLQRLTRAQTVAVWEADLRGLEAALLHETLVRNRKLYIQQVLALQRDQRSCSDGTNDSTEALAARSRSWTKQARRLAQVWGSTDALMAQTLFSDLDVATLGPYWTAPRRHDCHDSMDSIQFSEV
jgi:hypothetical protein